MLFVVVLFAKTYCFRALLLAWHKFICNCDIAARGQMGISLLNVQVKRVFQAKHVIRVCSSEYKDQALLAARKLIAEADRIRAQVDLRGASIAIDDCYQVCLLHI